MAENPTIDGSAAVSPTELLLPVNIQFLLCSV